MSCDNRDIIKEGIVNAISQILTERGGFVVDGKVSTSNDNIEYINAQFGENVIVDNVISPSDELIDKYLNHYLVSPESPRYAVKDHSQLTDTVLFNMTNRLSHPILSKWNGAYYINGEGKLDIDKERALEKNTQRLKNYLAFYNLPSDMVIVGKDMISRNGNKYRLVYTSPSPLRSQEEAKKQDKVKAITDFLSERFGYKDNVVFTTKADFAKEHPSLYSPNIESAVVDGKIYIFKTASNEVAAEELLHPFVTALKNQNPTLFNNLLKQARAEYPEIGQHVLRNYPPEIAQEEFVTQVLAEVFTKGFEEGKSKSFKDVMQDAFNWIKDMINQLLGYYIDNAKLPDNLTFNDIVEILNTTDTHFDTQFSTNPLYAKRPDSLYDIVYNYVSDADIRKKVEEVLKDLPKTVASIKNKLSEEEQSRIEKFVDAVKNASGERDELIAQLSMIMNVARTLNDLGKQVEVADKIEDDNARLAALYALNKAIDSFIEFEPILSELSNLLEEEVGTPSNLKDFYRQLNSAIAVPVKIKKSIISKTSSSLINLITEYHENIIKPEVERIDKEIARLRAEGSTDIRRSKQIDARIKKLQDKKKLLPTRETIERIFEGKYDDAGKISMWIEAAIANPHPLVSGLASMINDINIEINKEMIASTNEMQKLIDRTTKLTGKGLRDQEKLWEPFTEKYERVTRIAEETDKDGNPTLVPKYVRQKGLLSNYSPEYTKKFEEWEAWEDYYRSQIYKSEDPSHTQDMKDRWANMLEEKKNFIRQNSERKYLPEVYEMWDLLDKPIQMEDGTFATIRQLRGDYQNKIHIEQDLLQNDYDDEGRKAIYEYIDELVREMREMRNKYDDKGQLKTGSALEIAELTQQYYDLQKKYGYFKMTDEMKGVFEADLAILKHKLAIGEITQSEYDRQHNKLAVDEIDPKFYETLEAYSDAVSNYAGILSAIPELAPFLTGTKEVMKENYKKLKEVTRAFRDDDGRIDGVTFEKDRPDVRKEIKTIQETYEELKNKASKLRGLSISDSVRLSQLNSQKSTGNLTPQEQDELVQLQKASAESKALYNKYKKDIDNYLNALQELAELTISNTTGYYDSQVNNITSNLQASEDVQKQVSDIMASGKFTIGEDTYILQDGKWGHQVFVDFTPFSKTDDGAAQASKILSADLANKMLKNSDWWKANHYKAYTFDMSKYKYVEVERPIYIWIESKPKEEKWINRDQPAFKYKRYTIKEEYENPNYKYIMGYIPFPKQGMHTNPRYAALSADQKEILEQLRTHYRKTQENIPQQKKLGDVLPSQIKTPGENLVEATNNFKENIGRLFNVNFSSSDSEDDAFLLNGSMRNRKNKQIPLRFVGKIDEKNQSSDIPAMLLVFELATKKWEKLTKFEPFVKSLQDVASTLNVTETSRRGAKFSLSNVKKALTGNLKEETHEKEAETTVLSQTIDNLVDMFVYGRTSKEAIINAFGFDLDMNKASSALMGFSSKALFILNAFPAAKNTISTAIQSVVNSNTQQGYYSAIDYAWAQGQSLKYSGDYIHDFSRVGDKSYIGQFADYFSALSGNPINEYGRKTQFTLLKEKGELLSGMKAYSEFNAQMVQLLALAKSTKVSLNGQMVPIIEAYELDDKGTISLKKGADVTKEDELKFSRLIQRINADVAGRYRELERTYLETMPIGKLAMYMNRYFVPMWQNRYAGPRYAAETGNVSVGYAYESMSLLKDAIFLYQGRLSEQWKDMSPRERANAMKFIKDLSALIAMSVLVSLMGGGDDKKHLKQNMPLYNYMLGLAIGVNTETQSFIDPTDLVRKAQQPFMAVNQLKQLVKVLSLVPPTMLGMDSAWYDHGTGVKDGLHDKGDSKLLAQFLKLMGYSGVQFQPDELVKRQNALTQLR
jgi:hypothetical protein